MATESDKNIRRNIPPKKIDPLNSLRNHIKIVVVIVFIINFAGGISVFFKVKPLYTSNAVIKIEPVVPKILYGKEDASITPYYDDYVRTQINIVKSYKVLNKAIQNYKKKGYLFNLPNENPDQAVERLAVRLNISQIRDTQLFSLKMISRRKEGLSEIINSVADSYLDQIRNDQLNKDSSRLNFLRKRKKELEDKLSKNYSILKNISSENAIGLTDKKNIYVYLQAIVDLTQQVVKATSRRIEAETTLGELKKQLNLLKKLDISADVDDWVEKDWSIRDNRIQLSRKLQDLRLILSGVKTNHPDRKEYEENLKKLYEVQNSQIERAEKVAERVIRGKLISDQRKKILNLKTEYEAALSTEKELKKELKNAEIKASMVNTKMMEASTLLKDIQRLQDSLIRIDGRIDQIEVESRSSGRITLLTKARVPDTPSTGKRAKMLVIVILASLVSGLSFAIYKDKTDIKIHTPHDIYRVLGFPATGYVMDANEDKESFEDLTKAVIKQSASQYSEQIREISFNYALEHEDNNSQIFTCISMGEKQGTTTFVTNTLSALDVEKHKRILVDMNIYNPFKVPDINIEGKGICGVLKGEISLNEAIIKDSDYPFHILPYGVTENSQNHFMGKGITGLIDKLKKDYDYIVIDSPPLILGSEVKFLSKISDVAVLLVNAGIVNEHELSRVVNTIDRLKTKVISVVLNRVRFKRGRYFKDNMNKYYDLVNKRKEVIE
ncbi:MAG: hypothetical protein GY714_27615 [Desulfobacterales bacterium]|nr:hypothetical protein [Desulfobacterales bacterium]MCP4163560.1 hypothetical protein [Deltaproteobacteria bacterium]